MYPKPNPTGYTVQNLLSIADTKIQDIAHTGAVFRINIFIDCNLNSETCEENLDVKKLDIGQNLLLPIKNKNVTFYQEQTIQHLDDANIVQQRYFVGVQFLINVQVVATKFSPNRLIIIVK